MSRAWLDRLLWVPKDEISNIELLKKQLTVTSPYEDVQPVPTYRETGTHLGIPRHVKFDIDYEDKTIYPKLDIKFSFTGELWYNQQLAVNKWLKYYNEGITDTILKLPPRSGKTIIALKIAEHLQTPFLIITPTSTIFKQWFRDIATFTDITAAKIGTVRRSVFDYKGYKCSVGMLHSLAKDKYTEDFKNHWGLIIFDEIHKMGATEFSKVVSMFPARYRLGLSGTVERADKRENVYFFNLGKNFIELEGKEQQPKIHLITINYNGDSGRIPKWVTSKIGKRAKFFSLIADNLERNYIIAKATAALYRKGLRVLVLSERIRQLETIEGILTKKLDIHDVGIITGNTYSEDRERILKHTKVILGINSILGLGVTVEGLRGLVFACPLGDIRQSVARVRNIASDLPDPVVVDIIDVKYPQARFWYERRRQYYNRITYKQSVLDVF